MLQASMNSGNVENIGKFFFAIIEATTTMIK